MSPLSNTGDAMAQANHDNEDIENAPGNSPQQANVMTTQELSGGALAQAGNAPDPSTKSPSPREDLASLGSEILAAVNELLPLVSR